jgi:hypothetical protein
VGAINQIHRKSPTHHPCKQKEIRNKYKGPQSAEMQTPIQPQQQQQQSNGAVPGQQSSIPGLQPQSSLQAPFNIPNLTREQVQSMVQVCHL